MQLIFLNFNDEFNKYYNNHEFKIFFVLEKAILDFKKVKLKLQMKYSDDMWVISRQNAVDACGSKHFLESMFFESDRKIMNLIWYNHYISVFPF